ncbi:hypothetical protein WR25_09515 [Diploscapter pachys]|uniref:DNA-directed RNA polymerase n=1 Tax=Diploscapter pachys TaxID=2018661 RepID=A0A2A2J3L0_9BILA|nr:hypothetical protein WR25_09515 [Diploscapter pachys]
MWNRIRFIYEDCFNVAVLLQHSFSDYANKRKEPDAQLGLQKRIDEAKRRLKAISYIVNRNRSERGIYLNEEQQRLIQRTLKDWNVKLAGRKDSSVQGYDKSAELVKGLDEPAPSSSYYGNQYALDECTKEFYMNELEGHLNQEEQTWMGVKNILRPETASDKSGEDVIVEWKWKEKLEKKIDECMKERSHLPVWSVLSTSFTPSILATQLLSSLTAICSEGQNVMPINVFNFMLLHPVMQAIQQKFMENFQLDEKQFPMTTFESDLLLQLTSVLSQLIIESCTFPSQNANGRQEIRNAFAIKTVSFEEETSLSPEAIFTPARNSLALRAFHFQIPPRPWIDAGVGGPWFSKTFDIIRNLYDFRELSSIGEMRARMQSPQQARPVFDALNQLGSTPWRINKDLLEVLKQVFSMSYNAKHESLLRPLAVPMHAVTVDVPQFQDHFPGKTRFQVVKENHPEYVDYSRKTAQSIKRRNEYNSLWCWMLYRVVLAERYKDCVLFFPHNMDFRGRVYPISPYLSHMGDDVSRSLLKFAKGRPLGRDGMRWLKLHCINLTGKLKRASIAEREQEVERLMPLIIDSAEKPLEGKRWWMESEEPWQTLAICFEIRDALKHPNTEEFLSTLPIHQDGSCNGLQHYAAMGRDREGGEQVNLVPCERPNDVYSDVAARVELKRIEDEKMEEGKDAEIARELRKAMSEAVPRKVIKQTVMTTVYGVTMYGAVLQIKRQLKALDIDNEHTGLFATYLAKKTFASLNDVFTSSMQLKDWFRSCARGISSLWRPVEWVTPLGLPVLQPYVKALHTQGHLVHKPVGSKQVDAFPPNFVHSLDSTHMMLTSLHCSRRGITYASVHDCFWTHACTVADMNEICREQFIALHSLPLVEKCAEDFKHKYLTPEMTKILSPEMLTKMQNLFTVQVKPGKLDLDEIRNSVYFFS